jgi:hypothetical protein
MDCGLWPDHYLQKAATGLAETAEADRAKKEHVRRAVLRRRGPARPSASSDGVTQVHGLTRERQRANTADKAGHVRRFQDTNGDRCAEPGLSPSCARSAPRRHREEARQPPAGQARRRQPQRSRHPGAPARPDSPSKTPQPTLGGTGVFRAGSAALSCRARHCGRFHRNAHLRVTPRGGPGSYRPRERFTRTGRDTPCRRARTWRLAKEMTVKQTRIQRPRVRRARPWHEALPPDPRDPDVIRAKALARSGHPRRRVPGRAAPVALPAGL